ncbi:hypothetical protein [Streptomyces sp. NPDC050504]|uniref:hypothetical protein n=1 Tax=Streptomyces sp. NPDC050504 TaxID=3365618 RepID=UPI0037AD1750
MLDTTGLTAAVDRFADRLRAAPHSRLRQGAAAAGLGLARELAVRAQAIEEPGSAPREMPDEGVFTVGDQLAVAGRDLALALAGADGAGGADAETTSSEALDEAVALVEAAVAAAF